MLNQQMGDMPKHKFWLVMSFLKPGAQTDLSENLHIPGIREKM
jgi:hypothetical protein